MKREEGLFMRGKGSEKERHLNVSGPASLFAASFLETVSFKSLWSRETETRRHSSQDGVFLICDEMSLSLGYPSDVCSLFRLAEKIYLPEINHLKIFKTMVFIFI